MTKAVITKKAQLVDEVAEKLTASVSTVVVDYRGLTVDEVTALRKQLRDAWRRNACYQKLNLTSCG